MMQYSQQPLRPPFLGTSFDVVAFAASAGGLNALSQILAALPADFPAAIVVVQHMSPHHESELDEILGKRITLCIKQAEQGEQIRPGSVYIAPPNQHLVVNPAGYLLLSSAERVRFNRPSANVLFEAVANSFRHRAIAVVLTGVNGDGSAGVQAVKQAGGVVIAQDEATSDFFGMPGSAIETGCVDLVLPLNEIATILMVLMARGHP